MIAAASDSSSSPTDTDTRSKYKEARDSLLKQLSGYVDETNKFCIICFKDRDLESGEECRIRSHIIPDSVLRLFPRAKFLNAISHSPISIKDFSYKAYCKHRAPGVASCEDLLSSLGESTFKDFLEPFVKNINNETESPANDPKIYHCMVSIGWRILALAEAAGDEGDLGVVTRSCLELIRPFLRDSSRVPDQNKFVVMFAIAGKNTCSTWCRLTGCSDIGPLIGNVSFGPPPCIIKGYGRGVLTWEAIMGPLMIKYIYCDNHPEFIQSVPDNLSMFTKLPIDGKFTVLGYSRRQDLRDDFVQRIINHFSEQYSIMHSFQPHHWMQNNEKFLVLVNPRFGKYDSSLKKFLISTDAGLVQLYEQSHTTDPPSLVQRLTIYKKGSDVYLFAQQVCVEGDLLDGKKVIFSMSKIVRTTEVKYASLVPSEHHLLWYNKIGPALLALLRVLNPLNDEQLPIPPSPVVVTANYDDTLEEEDTLSSLFA